jgi:hypothetical protein
MAAPRDPEHVRHARDGGKTGARIQFDGRLIFNDPKRILSMSIASHGEVTNRMYWSV